MGVGREPPPAKNIEMIKPIDFDRFWIKKMPIHKIHGEHILINIELETTYDNLDDNSQLSNLSTKKTWRTYPNQY